MLIKRIKSQLTREEIAGELQRAIDASRFSADVVTHYEIPDHARDWPSYIKRVAARNKRIGAGIKIETVRLRERKAYCGAHPASCEITGERHARHTYLEGADWVEFDDLVNNVLDRLDVSAHVFTAICEIRRGRMRRITYGCSYPNMFRRISQWDRVGDDTDYADYAGSSEAPRSDFPSGTPGRYEAIGYDVVG